MTTKQLLEELRSITQANLELIRKKFSHLNQVQLNWKKDNDSWSINEIFAHLNQYAAYYHPAFLKKIEKTRFREPKEIFVSSPLGKSAWKSMKLGNAKNIKRRFKSPRSYNPSLDPSMVSGNDISTFQSRQEEMMAIIDKASAVNLRKAKIPISISKIVRLRLGDALLFVVYHNERHVQQALNVLNHSSFPKK